MFDIGAWVENQYLVLERQRGMRWTTYIAQDRISENIFVIKTLFDIVRPDASALHDFSNIARTWITLGDCDEIVKAYLLKELEGIPHLFIEYVQGPSIADILGSHPGKPLPMEQAIELMKHLISGLRFLHEANLPDGGRGVIHGNLTPRNILTSSGQIKITDIGLANTFRRFPNMVHAHLALGDITYTAPERLESPGETGKVTDIYSFGAIMYEVATGTPPMVGKKHGDLSHDIALVELAPPRLRNRSCPRWLEETILKCMARNPDNRFQSFEQIDAFMNEVLVLESPPRTGADGEKGTASVSRLARVRGVAKKESRRLDQYYIGVEHLMLGLLAEEESIVVSCFDDKISAEQLRSEILQYLPKGEGPWYWDGMQKTPRYKRVMKLARKIRRTHSAYRMLPQHLLLAILQEGRSIPVRVLRRLDVDVKAARDKLRREIERSRPAIFVQHIDSPTAGFTSRMLCTTEIPCFTPFVNRHSELARVRTLLLDDRKGVLIVGEPGVGKTALVHEVECIIVDAKSNAAHRYGGMLKLRPAAFLESAEESGELITNLLDAINEIVESNAIMVIENLPVLLGLDVKVPSGSIAGILEEYISSKGLLLVATATPEAYSRCQSEYGSLLELLEAVNLPEPSSEETMEMLEAAKETFELRHSVGIADDAFTAAVTLSGEITGARALPAKAFELLERACIAARLSPLEPEEGKALMVITAEHLKRVAAECG